MTTNIPHFKPNANSPNNLIAQGGEGLLVTSCALRVFGQRRGGGLNMGYLGVTLDIKGLRFYAEKLAQVIVIGIEEKKRVGVFGVETHWRIV